jgi:hypothetical protein
MSFHVDPQPDACRAWMPMTTPAPALTALLDELDRLRAAATPGPWHPATAPAEGSDETHAEYLVNSLRPDEGRPLWVAWAEPADIHDGDDVAYVVPVVTGDGPTSEANARYVAVLHDTAPRLTAAVRAALALAAELEGDAERHRDAEPVSTDGLSRAITAERHCRYAADRLRSALAAAFEATP